MKKRSRGKPRQPAGQESSGGAGGQASLLVFGAVVLGLVAVLYGAVLDAPFVFDDAKFLNEPLLQVRSVSGLETLLVTPGIPRKVGLLTFALNYLAASAFEPRAVRLVSVALHAANALLLLAFLRLLARDATADRPAQAWLLSAGTLVWMVHPVQTQAVSYAWQRFTPLCGFLYLLALVCVLRARAASSWRRAVWLVVAGLAGLLALGAKENAATLPLFAALVLVLFPAEGAPRWSRAGLRMAAAALLLAAVVAAVFLGPHWWEMIERDSLRRGFTPWQRVMTEWRVVVYYVTLLLWPHPARLNLDYEWPLSTGLLEPPTTLLSLGMILAAVVSALRLARRRPLAALAVLWFFGNLVIESSFIPLDLVFEHRLYLPSMLPLALGTAWALDAIPERRWAPAAATILVAGLAFWTLQRNQVWKDPVALWQDTARKSPNKARPHWNLGKAYFVQRDYARARGPTERALQLDPNETGALNNLAVIEIAEGRFEQARTLLERALQQEPDHFSALLNLGIVQLRLGRSQQAVAPLERALEVDPASEAAAASLVAAQHQLGNYERAVALARAGTERHPASARLFAFLGAALERAGHPEEARQALGRALELDPTQAVAREALARLK